MVIEGKKLEIRVSKKGTLLYLGFLVDLGVQIGLAWFVLNGFKGFKPITEWAE